MATVWLTYAWEDNKQGDVDFTAQELQRYGLTVKLDRWNISAGRRLWEQIEGFISKPEESDGWLLYATQASLQSQSCKEEFAYALDRALRTRGGTYPVIALFPGPIESSLIPSAIKTRLYVSLTDPDWKERVKAAVEGHAPAVNVRDLAPYYAKVHQSTARGAQWVIEVRPRAGTWSPFFAAVPLAEKGGVTPCILRGPRDRVPVGGGVLHMTGEGPSNDGAWWTLFADDEATPTQSYFVYCQQLPSILAFGVNGGQPQYKLTPRA
ncbi:hypothetical protein LCGC14_0418850 [marine sediment metagenome]|uniref:TIR domain-containing protein n=1 Tax=marine sediment metagenome TaxID=412755 RepID=A0A0F9T9M2_9ZZZZ